MSVERKKRLGRPSAEFAPFPRHTLENALRLAQSIQDNNAGEPFSRVSLAESIQMSPESSSFRALITSAGRYGITEGGQQAEKISLTSLGLSIVAPRSESEKGQGLRDALTRPELFNKFYLKFNGHKIPSTDLLKNTLIRDYKVSPSDAKSCNDILQKNAIELNLFTEIKGSKYLQLDLLGKAPIAQQTEEEGDAEEKEQYQHEIDDEDHLEVQKIPQSITKPTIFISHSKNTKILEQIKKILTFGEFDFKVAVEEKTTAIPIPEKIFGLMKDCNCALINISADEDQKQDNGSFGVNPNVLIEIGGAFLRYEQRIILLVDNRVILPSNLQGLYQCKYEGDELTWDAGTKLQEDLTKFKEMLKTQKAF